jgi:hypothetical protein
MKIEFELNDGRVVTVDSIKLSMTYAGFLLIDTIANANKIVIEKNLECPKDWGKRKLLKILPKENEIVQQFRTTIYVWLNSKPMNQDSDGSELACVWLDNFDDSIPLSKFIENKLKDIDWENNAEDYNL